MKNIKDILPRIARITAILLQQRNNTNDRNYNYQCIWCTIEITEKDQQDYYNPKHEILRSANQWVDNARIAFFQGNLLLTLNVLNELPNSFVIDNKQIINPHIKYVEEPNAENCSLIVSSERSSDYCLDSILPARNEVKYVKTWIDSNRAIEQYLMNSPKLSKQIKKMTDDMLGFNLIQMPQHLGNLYLVSYHPSLRSIDLCASNNPYGLFVKINRRKGVRHAYQLRVADYHQNGMMLYEKSIKLRMQQDHSFVELPIEPHRISVRLLDMDGNLIYNQDDISFIRSFDFTIQTQVQTIQLNIHNKSGTSKIKTISKYIPVSRQVSAASFSSEEYFTNHSTPMDTAENTFYFFDGDKYKKNENVNAAKDIIASILNKAKNMCYICDPYFSSNDFLNFVFPIKNITVPIRILSSKEFMCKHYDDEGQLITTSEAKKDERLLLNIISKYNEIIGNDSALCRILLGKSAVHDRFIVCDSEVWCLGSSFSEFGARATTLYKIPKESCRTVILQIEKWWSDNGNTQSLKDYVESK